MYFCDESQIRKTINPYRNNFKKFNFMKKFNLLKTMLLTMILLFGSVSMYGQVTLTGTSYTENFDGMGTDGATTPQGWSVALNATTTSLGTTTTALFAVNNWNVVAGGARNVASLAIGMGANAAEQNAATDRALAIRQVSGSDPGASFILTIANTTGRSNFTGSFDLQQIATADTPARTATWQVQYSSDGTSWIDANTTPANLTTVQGVQSIENITFTLGSSIENLASNVFIRIVTLTATSGIGNRPHTAIDNFTLTWEASTFDVTLNAGAGSVPQTVFADVTSIILPTPTIDCVVWTFAGWTISNLPIEETNVAPAFVSNPFFPSGNVTLYAVYKKVVEGDFVTYAPDATPREFVIAGLIDNVYHALPLDMTNTLTTKPTRVVTTNTSANGIVYVTTANAAGFAWSIQEYDTDRFTISEPETNRFVRVGTGDNVNIGAIVNPDFSTENMFWTISPGTTGTHRISNTFNPGTLRGLGLNTAVNPLVIGNYNVTSLNSGTNQRDIGLLPIGDVAITTYMSNPDCTIPTFNVTFNVGTGNPVSDLVNITEVTELPIPTHNCPNWTFAGWVKDGQVSETNTLLTFVTPSEITENIALYAVYRKGTGSIASLTQADITWTGSTAYADRTFSTAYGNWTGHTAIDAANIGIQINTGTGASRHLLSPEFTNIVNSITVHTISTAGGNRTIRVMDASGENFIDSRTVLGTQTSETSPAPRTTVFTDFDTYGLSQFWIDSSPVAGSGMLTITGIEVIYGGTITFNSNPDCITTNIPETTPDTFAPFAADGQVHFMASQGEAVEIFNVTGQLVYRGIAVEGLNSIAVRSGIALLRVGGTVNKLVVR